MYERYPISGIKQSYRHTRETRTVVMPVLIIGLITALAVFYIKSAPEEEAAPIETVAVSETEIATEEVSSPAIESEEESAVPVSAGPDEASEQEPANPSEPVSYRRAVPIEPLGQFTAWMTPSDLDAYIRVKNEGFSESFWNRGHWITSVEGRWSNGGHEFRITYDAVPDRDTWQWQYRINLDRRAFFEAMLDFQGQGFTLVSRQSFLDGSGSERFQAVWQRRIETPSVADNFARDR